VTESFSIHFLEKAILQLETGIKEYEQTPKSDLLRDGVIQRFEYTYELAWKTLKRFLEISQPSLAVIDQLSFPVLIRTAWEQGLLHSSWDVWKKFRDARNQTSHAYDEKKAQKVFSIIPLFLNEVKFLNQQLQKRVK
jgi:nucleotidyltransferase substrate binding protein (TIGR01987 family)